MLNKFKFRTLKEEKIHYQKLVLFFLFLIFFFLVNSNLFDFDEIKPI